MGAAAAGSLQVLYGNGQGAQMVGSPVPLRPHRKAWVGLDGPGLPAALP